MDPGKIYFNTIFYIFLEKPIILPVRWLSSSKKDFLNLQNWKENSLIGFLLSTYFMESRLVSQSGSMKNFLLKFSIHRIFAHQNGLFTGQTSVKKNFYQICSKNICLFNNFWQKSDSLHKKFQYYHHTQHDQ